jgi:uncharacterized protein YggE
MLGALILVLFLAALPACSKTPAPALPSSVASGAVPAPPVQTGGIASQGIAIPLPAVPPQGNGSAGSAPAVGSAQAAPNAAIAAPGSYYLNQPFSSQPQSTGIWVSGQGEVSVVPDVATLTLGVSSQASTVAQAQSAAANAMSSVMQLLKSRGIADKDITTVGYNIYPVMDYKNNTITGYQVSNSITVKIRNISDSGPIIDSVTAAAGNLIRISGISFDTSDPAASLKQARQQAMADANSKASQLASLGGVKLGLPTYITETTGSYAPQPIYFNAAAAAPAATTPINPGQTQVSVNVQVVYAIQ